MFSRSLLLNVLFVCFSSIFAVTTKVYTPCNYPIPGRQNFRDECSSSYFNLDYLCVIDGLMTMSKTDADQINSVVTKYDYYKNFDVHIAVAVLDSVYLPISMPRFKYQITQDSMWNCTDNNNNESREMYDVLQWRNGTTAKRYVDWFARTLGSRWFGNDCGSYILFFTVTGFVADWDKRKLLDFPFVQISFGKQLQHDLSPTDEGVSFYDNLQRDIADWRSEGLSSVATIIRVLDQVARKLKRVNDDRNRKFEHTIPFWAIYVFMGCFALLGVALLLDCLIVRRKALSLRGGSSGSASSGTKKSDNVQVHLYF